MTLILGIDPGSRTTGYGIVQVVSKQLTRYVASGHLALGDGPILTRLQTLHTELEKIATEYSPEEVSIEEVFMHTNPSAALKLGQARGAAIVAAAAPGRELFEYSARQIKAAVVGYGAATKVQVQNMVKQILGIKKALQADEADGLAIALCHAHSRDLKARLKLANIDVVKVKE